MTTLARSSPRGLCRSLRWVCFFSAFSLAVHSGLEKSVAAWLMNKPALNRYATLHGNSLNFWLPRHTGGKGIRLNSLWVGVRTVALI